MFKIIIMVVSVIWGLHVSLYASETQQESTTPSSNSTVHDPSSDSSDKTTPNDSTNRLELDSQVSKKASPQNSQRENWTPVLTVSSGLGAGFSFKDKESVSSINVRFEPIFLQKKPFGVALSLKNINYVRGEMEQLSSVSLDVLGAYLLDWPHINLSLEGGVGLVRENSTRGDAITQTYKGNLVLGAQISFDLPASIFKTERLFVAESLSFQSYSLALVNLIKIGVRI